MAKKAQSKPMTEILTRLHEFEYIRMVVFEEDVILKVCTLYIGRTTNKSKIHFNRLSKQDPVENWPICDCLVSFHSKGFPLEKAIQYAQLRKPFVVNNLHMQYDIQVSGRSLLTILNVLIAFQVSVWFACLIFTILLLSCGLMTPQHSCSFRFGVANYRIEEKSIRYWKVSALKYRVMLCSIENRRIR